MKSTGRNSELCDLCASSVISVSSSYLALMRNHLSAAVFTDTRRDFGFRKDATAARWHVLARGPAALVAAKPST